MTESHDNPIWTGVAALAIVLAIVGVFYKPFVFVPIGGILLLIASKAELPIDRIWIREARRPKRLLAFPDADHTKGLATHPREYERALVAFFDRGLLDR